MTTILSRSIQPSSTASLPILFVHRSLHTTFRLAERQRITPKPSPSNQDDYYSLLLSSPLPSSASPSKLNSAPGIVATNPVSPANSSTSPRANIVFGSRLAGPAAARAQEGWAEARPAEPDNCCMSGCVHCVWDLYREEVEEWAARQKQTYRREVAQESEKARNMRGRGKWVDEVQAKGGMGDMDGDGGDGGEFQGVDVGQEGLFAGVPVGIREFMNTEKRLRERKRAGKG